MLGAVLLSDTALPALIIDERLQAADFYRESHGLIFTAMLDLHGAGEPVDALTLVEHLKQAGQLDAVGGRATVDLLAGSVPAVGNVRQYARIVRENAMLRRLLNAAYEIQSKVHSHEAPPRELVDLAERTILEVAHEDSRKDFRSIEVVLDAETTKLAELSRAGKAITGTASGYEDLDTITGGFQPGNLIILAARPSMGKCLAGSTLVYDPTTGGRRRIDDAGRRRSSAARTRSWRSPRRRTCGCTPPRRPPACAAACSRRTGSRRGSAATSTRRPTTRCSRSRAGASWASSAAGRPDRRPARGRSSAHRGLAALARPAGGGVALLEAPPADDMVLDVTWDAVASIEPLGEQETYDLTVPGDHNFVANDIVVHNSALMANFCENAALENKKAVALFSLEMSESELAQRFIASQASIKGDDLRKGNVPNSRWPKIMQASARLAASPLYIDDSSDLSVLDVRAKARRLAQQHADGLGLIVIDYLQLMRAGGSVENRVEQIWQISRGLKTLARELEVPVIALSQLNRGVEQRTDKRPVLSDLRESGAIEQDADLVMFIYRDEYYDQESEREGIADVIISKHRNGGLGTVELTFQKEFPRFMSYVAEDRY